MSQRWDDLYNALKAFHKRVAEDSSLACEIARVLRHEMSKYVGAPDNERVRLYKIKGDPHQRASYFEQRAPEIAVEQTSTNHWTFGMGIVIGPDTAPEFQLAWPVCLRITSDGVIAEIYDQRTQLSRRQDGLDYQPVCELIYNLLMDNFAASMTPRFGFLSR
jgi:hypothetical protein